MVNNNKAEFQSTDLFEELSDADLMAVVGGTSQPIVSAAAVGDTAASLASGDFSGAGSNLGKAANVTAGTRAIGVLFVGAGNALIDFSDAIGD